MIMNNKQEKRAAMGFDAAKSSKTADLIAGLVNYPAAKDCEASGPDGPSLFLLRRNAAS